MKYNIQNAKIDGTQLAAWEELKLMGLNIKTDVDFDKRQTEMSVFF